jgi:hypothetical protein
MQLPKLALAAGLALQLTAGCGNDLECPDGSRLEDGDLPLKNLDDPDGGTIAEVHSDSGESVSIQVVQQVTACLSDEFTSVDDLAEECSSEGTTLTVVGDTGDLQVWTCK